MENNKSSKFITWMLMVFIMLIIVVQFSFSVCMYIITPEIIICLLLLVVLCLSDSFDTLSIPKLLSMSKRVKEVKDENNSLKEANMKLISQIVSINSTNNQNIFLPNSYNTIGSTNIDDVANKKEDVEELGKITEDINISENTNKDNKNESVFRKNRITISERRKYEKNMQIFLLKKLLTGDIENSNLQYNVKLIGNNYENNVMKTEVRFDALKVEGRNRIFYEIKTTPFLSSDTYRLHYMLSVLEKYKESNNCPIAKLCLVVPNIDEELGNLFPIMYPRYNFLKREVSNLFEPAITNGLLEIVSVDITKKELDDYIKEQEKDDREVK